MSKRLNCRNFLACGAIVLLSAVFASAGATKLPTASLTFPDGKKITVELAMNPTDREVGLMFRKSIPKNYGMLFVFSSEQPLEFWMKNTWINLDMIFIDKEKKITEVHRDVPRSSPATPDKNLARRSGKGQYVLELPQGAAARHHLKPGQKFAFEVPIPLQ